MSGPFESHVAFYRLDAGSRSASKPRCGGTTIADYEANPGALTPIDMDDRWSDLEGSDPRAFPTTVATK